MEGHDPGVERMQRASAIETLLARLSGEVAPIWVTFGVVTDEGLDAHRLRAALAELVAATPRLQLAWDGQDAWRLVVRSPECLDDALRVDEAPASVAQIQAETLASPIDLGRDLPLRLHLRAVEGGHTMVVFQLHHAIGDARAFCRAAIQLLNLYHAPGSLSGPWGGPAQTMPDRALLRLLAARPGWVRALGPAALLLAPRGASMPRTLGDQPIGAPMVQTRRLRTHATARKHAALVTAAIAAAAAPVAVGERLRLRMPVDLAAQLGQRDVLANTCVAIPVELPRVKLMSALGDAQALTALTQGALGDAIRRGVPYVALLECLATARLVSAATIRHGARPGLVAHPRTNTLVVTHVGDLDKTFARLPGTILDAWGHTPTWGVNSWTLRGQLTLNATCFEGLWTQDELSAFADAVAAQVARLDEELWS
jgi:hypothetical protein